MMEITSPERISSALAAFVAGGAPMWFVKR
jgi:hypothetical protein